LKRKGKKLLFIILLFSFLPKFFNINSDFLTLNQVKNQNKQLILKNDPSTAYQIKWADNGVIVSEENLHQWFPVLTSDGQGGVIIAWQDNRNGFYDIYAQRIDSSGDAQWTPNGIVICNATLDQEYPTIINDGLGGAIITWQDKRNGFYDIYAQRINSSGDIQWVNNGTIICDAGDDQELPQIISDDLGDFIIIWEDDRVGGGQFDIYGQKINLLGGKYWGVNGIAICDATNSQRGAYITSDGSGGAIISWFDWRIGKEIYVQKINSSGDEQWIPDGVRIRDDGLSCYVSDIVNDGSGGAIIAWWGYNALLEYDVYSQRINSTGDIQWKTNGVVICNSSDNQKIPKLISNDNGGAIITWMSENASLEYDSYAQRINGSGEALWALNGSIVRKNALPTQIFSDGFGGAIITGADDDGGGLYTQRINSSGAVQWNTEGALISSSVPVFPHSAIKSDSGEGIFITWAVFENPSYNVYTQHFSLIPGKFNLTSNSDSPDEDGKFELSWSISNEAENYSIYQYDNYITEIDEKLIELTKGEQSLSFAIDSYSNGDYYFIICAFNEYGNFTSNCIRVKVQYPVTSIPFLVSEIFLTVCVLTIVYRIFKSKYRKIN
jgi:hypothetical protein